MMKKDRSLESLYALICRAAGIVLLLAALIPAAPARAVDEENCLICHKHRGMSYIDENNMLRLLYISEPIYQNSPHGLLNCRSCHADIKDIPHKKAEKVDCLKECHLDKQGKLERFTHKQVGDILQTSVHSPIDEKGVSKPFPEDYPTCKTCHQDPLYRPLSFFKKIRPGVSDRIMSRCLTCHDDKTFIKKFYSHFTSRMQKLRSGADVVKLCSKCHEDADFLKRHNQPDVVYAYWETYHGKAVYMGDDTSPDCLDCHASSGGSIHSMHGKKDPRSAVYPANRLQACSNIDCHPNANQNLTEYKVHLLADRVRHPIEFYVSLFFVILTLTSFIPIMIAAILDLIREILPIKHRFEDRVLPPRPIVDGVELGDDRPPVYIKNGIRYFKHLTFNQRQQHVLLMVSFAGLVLTGIPMKYMHVEWMHTLYKMMGGIELAPVIHRGCAVVMGFCFLFHFLYIACCYVEYYLKPLQKAGKLTLQNALKSILVLPMVPNLEDLRNIWRSMLYRLYITNERPSASRFNFKEKFGYLAVFWGVPVIGLSGVVLWGQDFFTQFLPGNTLNFCLIAHSDEALLATMVIMLWHIYNTHLKLEHLPMGMSWLTGTKKEEEISGEHHGYYLGALKSEGLAPEHAEGKRGVVRGAFRFVGQIITLVLLIGTTGYLTWIVFDTVFGFHMVTATHIPEKHYLDKPRFLEEVLLEDPGKKKFYRGFRVLKEQDVTGHFHNITMQVTPDERSYCIKCHGDFPHGSKSEIRTYLNMHDFYLACQTCHIKRDTDTKYTYKWYNRANGAVLQTMPDLSGTPLDELNIKLIPGLETPDGWKRLDSDPIKNYAESFINKAESRSLSLEQKKESIEKIHSLLSKKSITCQQCHNEKQPLLPYSQLGYSPERIKQLTRSELVQMIENFDQFRFPTIFERKNQ
jgi:cytochrome b subunit of formate dehydrogenase